MPDFKRVLVVIVGLVMVFMAAEGAFAGITGSKHDFTGTGSGPITSQVQMCATCHVPHKPVRNVPLWAHSLTESTFDLYNTNTEYDGVNSAAYDASPSGLIGTSSRLCLSCHDGTLAVVNSVYLTVNDPSWMLYDNGTAVFGGPGSRGLESSHPIGVDYSQILLNQPFEFNEISSDPDIKLENGKIQCTSCHDPHNKLPGTKMLVKENSINAALCITCHNK